MGGRIAYKVAFVRVAAPGEIGFMKESVDNRSPEYGEGGLPRPDIN